MIATIKAKRSDLLRDVDAESDPISQHPRPDVAAKFDFGSFPPSFSLFLLCVFFFFYYVLFCLFILFYFRGARAWDSNVGIVCSGLTGIQSSRLVFSSPSFLLLPILLGLTVSSIPSSRLFFYLLSLLHRWISEKYDGIRGIWNPVERTLFSRWGTRLNFPNYILDSLLNFWLDGEVSFLSFSFPFYFVPSPFLLVYY